MKRSRLLGAVCALAIVFMPLDNTNAALITYAFEGVFNSTSSLFNIGDTFSGTYTFDNTASVLPHPDSAFDTQSVAISNSLPGTSWSLFVSSTAVADFSVSGTSGVIAVGNNTSAFGDRYDATLSSTNPLPGGLTLEFFQISLLDSTANGADMLSSGAIDVFPNLSLTSQPSGRFYISDETNGCTQCYIAVTSLTAVPIPTALWLFSSGLLGLVGISRRKKL